MAKHESDPVLVVSDLMLDEAWMGCRERICPDAAARSFTCSGAVCSWRGGPRGQGAGRLGRAGPRGGSYR